MRLLTVLFAIALGCCAAKSLEGPRRAIVVMQGSDIHGKILLEQASINSPVKIRGVVYGLEPGQHGIHIHKESQLGDRCELVGAQFNPTEKSEGERPVGYLGNVKTFSGVPSRTDINVISSTLSLYEDHSYSVLRRSLVIHALPNDYGRTKNYGAEDLLACGRIESTEVDREEILRPLEREQAVNRLDRIEKSILDGEKPWENVRHPFYGGVSESTKTSSNVNVDGTERSDLTADSLSLKSAVPTNKIWKGGRTYEYDYKGFIATGMFGLSPKVSGGSIEGRLVVEPVDENTVNVALAVTKAKMFNEDVLPELLEADPGTESRIVDREHVEKPFQVKIVNGKVESVSISKDEPLWTVNFKRALAAKLQLQLDGTSGVFGDAALAGYYADNTVYHAMEGCSSGECETWYHISEVSEEQLNAEPELLAKPELCDKSPVFEIIKNRDFDKCRILPVYNYVSLQGLKCNVLTGAGCENKISHVDLVRIIGCRSSEGHFIVQRVKATDKLIFKPFSYETEATEGKTIQHLSLRAIHPAGTFTLAKRIHSDVHLYQTLTYSFDDDYKTHGPLMGKPSLRHVNSPMIMEADKETLIREAERLLNEIVADLESESFYFDPSSKFVPAKISMLRRALASLDYSDLMAFVAKAMTENKWSTHNQIILDSLVLSGTNPALMIVRDLILKGRVTGEQAVQAVSAIVSTVETPTKELLTSFIEMLKSEVVTGHRQLKITSALFVSRLVYQACINSTMSLNMFPKLVMGEFCNAGDNAVNQLVAWLTEQLNNAADSGERIAMLTALGNIGHEIVLPSILPYITSCEPSTSVEYEWIERNRHTFESGLSKKELRQKWLKHKQTMTKKDFSGKEESANWHLETPEEDRATCNIIRTKAIFALTNLALEKKEVVTPILMPISFNKAEETEVRLAALSLLFASNPPQAFWNRVALSTWFEPNEQIAHFIYTTIASAVANKSPLHRHMVVRAESVLPLMKPMLWTSHSALHYIKAGYQEKVRVGYLTETLAFPGFESFIPSNFYNTMYVNMGPWFTKLMEFSINGKQVEKFADLLLGKPNMRSFNKILSGLKARRDDADITSFDLNKIHEELKIEARATGQPELYVYINLLDNYQRFFTLNPTTIMDTVEKLILDNGFATKDGKALVNYHKYVPVLDSFIRIPSSMGLAYSVVGHHSLFISLKAEINGGLDMSNFAAKVEGTLKPAVIAKLTTRVMSETPFARAYPMTGVNLQTAAALPGRFAISADLKTAKVGITWEFLGEKLHLLKNSIIPFTSIRKVDDFTPALLLKETKKISLLEEPKEVKAVYGRPLGLNLIWNERADVKALKAPLAYTNDWFGTVAFYNTPSTLRLREMALILDNASSESKVIKTWISAALKTSETVKSTADRDNLFAKRLYDTLFEKAIKMEHSAQEKEEWSAQKFQRVFNTMTSASGASVDLSVELSGKSADVAPRRIGASIVYSIGDAGKTHRAAIMMEHRNERSFEADNSFVLCADFESIFPEKVAMKRDLIRPDAESATTLKVAFGKTCTDDRKVTITAKLGRAEEKASTIRTKWEEERCQKQELTGMGFTKECMSTSRMAAILNKAEIIVDYNEMPAIVRNATAKFSNAVRHFLAPHLSENDVEVRNTENQIRIESVYYPIGGSMDLRVFKPKSNTFFHAIDVHPVAEVLLPARMALPRDVFVAPNVCLVDRETVTTFDGLNYNASISSCDQVIAKDCSGRYKFAVLARHESGKKIVTLLLNKERIEVNADEMKVKVNDMELSLKDIYVVKDAENKIIAEIRRTPDNFVEVDAPAHLIRVTCDAKEVAVSGSAIHRGRLCGLCGSATGNKVTDLTGPRRNTLPKELMSAAYELQRPAGCKSVKVPEIREQLRRIQDKYVEEKKSTVFGITDAQPLLPRFQQTIVSMHVPRSTSQCSQYRNKMVVRDNQRCFSTVSLPKCTEGCKPASMVEKKLPFHCMPLNFLSEKLSEEVSVRPLNELSGKEVSFVQTFNVPSACVPAL